MVPNIGAKPSRVAQGLKKTHDNDNLLITITAAPLQKPPKVQTQATIK